MRYLVLMIVFVLFGCKSKKETPASGNHPRRNRILIGVTISGIRVLSFPKYGKDGEKWDAYAPFATEPDIFVTMLWNENVLYKSETINECQPDTPLVLTKNLPLNLKPFDQPITLEVFDEDGISSNDNMAYLTFNPLDFQDKSLFILEKEGAKIELKADWYYK